MRLASTAGAVASVWHYTVCLGGSGGLSRPHLPTLPPGIRAMRPPGCPCPTFTMPRLGAPGGQAGMNVLLCLPCPAQGAACTVSEDWHGRPPLTTCPFWLLQMGGGGSQEHEPADHGGHAERGEYLQRSRSGGALGRTVWPGDTVSRGIAWGSSQHSPYSVLLPAASVSLMEPRGLFCVPCFGARKGPAQYCRKAQGQELGSLGPSPGASPGLRGDLGLVTPLFCLFSPPEAWTGWCLSAPPPACSN